jgi:hypothetical protein
MLQTAVADASRRLTARGEPVRYLRCTFLPDEQRSICLFEAVNAEVVRRVNENAQAPFTAIEAAVEVPPPIEPEDD